MTNNQKERFLIEMGKRIYQLRVERGMTQDELARRCGYASDNARSSIQKVEAGKVDLPSTKITLIAKALGVTENAILGDSLASETEKAPSIDNASYIGNMDDDFVTFQIIGSIAAGYDGRAIEEETGETLQVPRAMLRGHKPEDFMVLRVHGNSMAPLLLDGDRAIVKRCTSVDSGSIAVVLYNSDEATIKRVRYINGQDWVELVPANEKYPIKRIEGSDLECCKVIGKVVDMMRHFD